MPLIDYLKGSFSAGELSPLSRARSDVQRYQHGAAQLENWIVLTQGGVTRRPGTRHVAAAKHSGQLCILRAFEASVTDAYILEIGHLYIRFYRDGAQITDGGAPVEVASPFREQDLRLVRTAQSNDVMLLVHPSHAPQRLSRLSDTEWVLTAIPFLPPPIYEAGVLPANDLTLSALTGTITVTTAVSGTFLAADVQRPITSGLGRGVITAVASDTEATVVVRDAFSSLSIDAGDWTIGGSPVASCKLNINEEPGTEITLNSQVELDLLGDVDGATELLSNTIFAAFTSWDTSGTGGTIASGTHTGDNDELFLYDSAADFLAAGVRATQTVNNTTDASSGIISSVGTSLVSLSDIGGAPASENNFDTDDAYTITQTGYATTASGELAILSGGTAGTAWLEQAVSTTAGQTYKVKFEVSQGELQSMVGTATHTSNLYPETTFEIGKREYIFTATSSASYVQWRTQQPEISRLFAPSVKAHSIDGWRGGDLGKYVRINNGLVRITSVASATKLVGEVLRAPDADTLAPPGAWSLESAAWSAANGWPSAVVLYEGRLYFGGTTLFPQTLWGSAIDDFFNFGLGANDDDALEYSFVDSGGNITLNLIRWIMPAENMLVGTTHGEYRLIGSGDDPLTPRFIPRVRIQSTYGSDTVQPLKIGAALLFAQRQGSKIREMVFDSDTNTTFVARDITVLSEHLLRKYRVLEMAYQQEPTSIVWAIRSDGTLLGMTYDLREEVLAWHRHVTAGSFESTAIIPHPTANSHQAWHSVKRTIGGSVVRHIEYFDPETPMTLPVPVAVPDPVSGEDVLIDSWDGLTVDDALVFTGGNQTLTGLDHLEGEIVAIVGDGAVLTSQRVAAGQVTLDYSVETAFVGLPYSAKGRTLPIELQGGRGSIQRSRKRWVELGARLFESLTMVLKGERLPFRKAGQPMDQGPPPGSGDIYAQPLGWDRDGGIPFVADQPLPCTIVGLLGTLDVEAEPQGGGS